MADATIQSPGSGDPAVQGHLGGALTTEMIDTDRWTDRMVTAAGIPIIDAPFVTVGGGIGSFVTVDYLRISGVPSSAIKVITQLTHPWESYEYLTTVSQIPRRERLRSDSASTPDNIWGFPSYAVREAFSAHSLKEFLRPLLQILVEPIFDDYYTPRAGQAFESMARECRRIGYQDSTVTGQVRMVRRRDGGGYFTLVTPPAGTASTQRIAYRGQYVHIAIGYPGLRFLPDLRQYREQHRDLARVVNAYEPHEQVYQRLRRAPGTVLVRGGGIVASRVLQRLMDDREQLGLQTRIVHLFRTYVTGAHGPHIFMRRPGGNGWAYQGFNYPKSVWGGQLKSRMRKLEGEDRARLYEVFGGTNTPKRRRWQRQMRQGRTEGWYTTVAGKIDAMNPEPGGEVSVKIQTSSGVRDLRVAAVIDCTGLEADIREHRVLGDLLDHSGAGRNPLGRLDVERDFEVRGTRSEPGKLYASGSATLGGYFPGVDTFLGLQIAAQEITDDLARRGFCPKIGPLRSIGQWWRWVRNRPV
jgi:hypothetical protein